MVAALLVLCVGLFANAGAVSAAQPGSATTRPSGLVSPSSGCKTKAPTVPGLSTHTITVGGLQRVYQLDIPRSYTAKKPYAIVFGLHPLSVSYQFMADQIGFADMQEHYHFIGVAPSGLTIPAPYWDAAPTARNYDVTFLSQLLTQLEQTMCLNTAQVFSTGISNGAQMSSLLGCRLSTRLAAIAPVEGEEYLTPCNGRPMPILAFHGTADPILPYTGGGLNATQIAKLYAWHSVIPPGMPKPLGIDQSMRLWARHNGCKPKPVEVRVAFDVQKRTWTGCKATTILYIIDGGGHGWPGKPVPAMEKQFGHDTSSIDATSLVFKFFFDR
jgi:polyhydroxybutyrate depolymerase